MPNRCPELRGYVKHRLTRADDRYVDKRASAVNPEIECAEGHRGIIAFALRLQIGGMVIGRDERYLCRSEAAERRWCNRNDPDLYLGGRKAFRHLFAQATLLRWIVADDKRNADHSLPLMVLPMSMRHDSRSVHHLSLGALSARLSLPRG